jgi:hypothetical protein
MCIFFEAIIDLIFKFPSLVFKIGCVLNTYLSFKYDWRFKFLLKYALSTVIAFV